MMHFKPQDAPMSFTDNKILLICSRGTKEIWHPFADLQTAML